MDKVGLDVIQQSLVVRDDEAAGFGGDAVDAFGYDAKRIDVQS